MEVEPFVVNKVVPTEAKPLWYHQRRTCIIGSEEALNFYSALWGDLLVRCGTNATINNGGSEDARKT